MSNNSDNQSLPLDQFLEIPLENIKATCEDYIQNILGSNVYPAELLIHYPDISISNSYKSFRNYSEYKDLFELFTKNNPKIINSEFPSRIAFGKSAEEIRVKFFQKFLNKILESCLNNDKKEENLSLLYNFIFKATEKTTSKLTKEKIKKYFNIDSDYSDREEDEEEEEKSPRKEPKEKKDINNSSNKKDFRNKTYSSKNLTIYNNPAEFEEDRMSNNSNCNSVNIDDNKSIDNNLNFDNIKRNTINFFNKKFNSVLNNKESFINGIRRSISIDEKENNSKDNNIWENLYVKTSLKDYSPHTVKIHERCLILFDKDRNDLNNIEERIIIDNTKDKDDDYYIIIPLYKINLEIYRLIYQPEDINKKEDKNNMKFLKQKFISSQEIYEFDAYAPNSLLFDVNSEIVIRLYHDYDRFETFIKFDWDWRIKAVKNFLSKIEQGSYATQAKSLYIDEVTESYMDSFGNIMINVINFKAPNYEGKVNIKVNLEPYTMPTKTIMSKGVFNFNQKFILPMHNRFKYLKFFVYKKKEESFFKKEGEKLIAKCEIPLPKLINIYYIQKKPLEIKVRPIKEKQKKKLKYSNMSIEFEVFDYSTILSLLVKNTNKRVLDDYPLYNKEGNSEEPYTIGILLKRIKRVLAWFKDIYYFYKMLEHFKYPVLSSSFILFVIIYTFFCEPRYILNHILIFVISILIYYSSVFQTYINPKLNYFLLYYRNKYDTPSKIAITESQKNKEEVAQSDYLIKKKGFSFSSPIKELKEYKHAYIDLLFRLSRIASFFEKFKNLFIWTDPLLSLYMILLLILVLLVVWNFQFRYIACMSIVKKFFFGTFYYKNKLINNKEIAQIVVRDAFNIWQKEKAKEKAKEKSKEKSKEKDEKKNDGEVIKTMEKRALDDEKLKNIIKNKLYEHSNIILSDDFYQNMETIGDVIEELGKVNDVLKIKRLSSLFHFTKNNSKIYRKDIDPEDVFAYFIQNIKSDYYRARNGFITTDIFKNEGIIKEELDIKDKKQKTLSNDIANIDLDKILEK